MRLDALGRVVRRGKARREQHERVHAAAAAGRVGGGLGVGGELERHGGAVGVRDDNIAGAALPAKHLDQVWTAHTGGGTLAIGDKMRENVMG